MRLSLPTVLPPHPQLNLKLPAAVLLQIKRLRLLHLLTVVHPLPQPLHPQLLLQQLPHPRLPHLLQEATPSPHLLLSLPAVRLHLQSLLTKRPHLLTRLLIPRRPLTVILSP